MRVIEKAVGKGGHIFLWKKSEKMEGNRMLVPIQMSRFERTLILLIKDIRMGIPRFYKWLKGRYPLIRFDLSDPTHETPIFDNMYIDFNALVYQCIRESGCFLKNKVKPLTEEQIIERVFEYLLELVRVVNPKKFLYIALDGVAPRAKINQSRDRRFKSGVDDIDFFNELVQKIGIENKEIFQANSISPGTQFLYNLCLKLKGKIMELMSTEWRDLNVLFSDCCVPGEGEHKIMEFLRYSKSIDLFNKSTTHCVYSPDADVILLTLTLNLDYICIIKEDTSVQQTQSWTATSTNRKFRQPLFEFVMVNILREYFQMQFAEVLQKVKSCNIQKIINDLVLLMAFVGNDFLPNEFCFVLKDNHLDSLFKNYRDYLLEHEEYINNDGKIDWNNVSKLLKLAKRFEANMISEMKAQKKSKNAPHHDGTVFDEKEDRQDKEQDNKYSQDSELEKFQVQDNKIVHGIESYYQSRFNIQDRYKSPLFEKIIIKYIQGLEFYCQYYYKGLPSWSWNYNYHYTPLLCDVDDYISHHKINIELKKDEPYDPILALMFMLPQQNFGLLPKSVAAALTDPKCILKTPIDYFPKKFELDKFETLKYNKHAIIEFLNESDVRKVYESIPKTEFTKDQLQRNERKKDLLFFENKQAFTGIEVLFNERYKEQIRKIIRPKYDQKQTNQRRFPTLYIYGQNLKTNDKGCIVPQIRYKHNGNPSQLLFFNNFIGYIDRVEKITPDVKEEIENAYARAGIFGNCENYFIMKRARYVREIQRFHPYLTNRQVIVPDFAVSKAPNYDYVHKTKKYENRELYKLKERVVVLSQKYFGCVGTIEQLGDKEVKVKLSNDPIKSQEKIQQFEQDFYTLGHVLNELDISKDTLFAIMSEVIVLPKMGKKKDFNERLPTALNFGLNFIDIYNIKIVPRFVRCDFTQENTKNPQAIFDYLEISKTALDVLQKYIGEFHWLVQALEQNRSSKLRKEFKATSLFPKVKDPNIQVYSEFVKLYQLDIKGAFQSIYSKIADPKYPNFYTQKKGSNAIVSFSYHEVFSRNQALISPPAYKTQPEYHDIGSRVILLRTLEIGYVTAIDDNWIYVLLGKNKRSARVRFMDLFNENWEPYLSKEVGKVWNQEVSYYTPTYWKKAIA